MQHLNIPLKRHTKTTPPFAKGGVVWLLMGLLVVSGFLAYRVSTLWFNRGTILSLAPSDTIIAIELKLNKQTAPFLFDWLDGVPLLSDRSLELRDLAPYVRGDLAVFVTSDGSRSVAIRSFKDALPSDLLTRLSITTQNQGSFVLLSSTLVPISGIESFISPILPSLGKTWLGRVIMPQDGLMGSLVVSDASLSLEVQANGQAQKYPLSEATVVLNGLSWGEEDSVLPGLQRLLSANSHILDNATELDIAVVPAESGIETLLKIKTPYLNSAEIIEELKQIGAFARPTISTQILPDGSELEEILVQPELVSLEEITTMAGISYRVPVGGGIYILVALYDGGVLFSNSQDLLEKYASRTDDTQVTDCSEITSRVSPSFLVKQTSLDSLRPQLGFLSAVFDDFSTISFEFKKYSTIVHLCRL